MSNVQMNYSAMKWIAILIGVLLLGGLLGACASGIVTVTATPTAAGQTDLLPNATAKPGETGTSAGPATSAGSLPKGASFNLNVSLSAGQAAAAAVTPMPVASGEPLTQPDIDALLARLPALPTALGDQTQFNRPPESLPVPRPGVTIQQPFPPADTAPTPAQSESGPLQVLRHAPEGEIPVAPFLSVTFNQAMVPLTTLSDLAAADVPVQIQPALPGKWRWLGTKTLTFEYDSTLIDRLPKATQYNVTVPAGTKSVSGGRLAQAVSWTFTTPPPSVVNFYPYDGASMGLRPLFFASFDQRIDPASVLAVTHVSAGGQTVSVALASADEVAKDAQVSALAKNSADGRWLAFRAAAPFTPDSTVSVTFGPGLPSAEGPLVSQKAQTYNLKTYAPLRIEDQSCSATQPECPPLSALVIRFNNPLDEQIFSPDLLKIEPAIPGANINTSYDSIIISGQTQGRTTYTVTVSGQLQDTYAQKLGTDARLTFKVGAAQPVLVGPPSNFISLDPAAVKPVVSVYATNYSELAVKIQSVQPADWPAFKEYMRSWQPSESLNLPGKPLLNETMRLNLPADTLSQVDVDLSKYLKDGTGQFVVVIGPTKPFIELPDARNTRLSRTFVTWVQITKIGLDAFSDQSSLLVWATDLRSGAPLNGVSLQTSSGATFSSGPDGTAKLNLPAGVIYLVGTLGTDTALLPRSNTAWSDEPWSGSNPVDELRWYVFDDRGMYRPGEDVHIKGIVRRIGSSQTGDVGLAGSDLSAVSYTVSDPQGNAITNGSAAVDALGGFDLTLSLPKDINLGQAQVVFKAQGSPSLDSLQNTQWYHYLQVQEFRRPEFEVTARNESSGPYFAGGQATLAVQASYYAGGALPNADVTWNVTTSPSSYSPPNWPDYTFGEWTPWWEEMRSDFGPYRPGFPGQTGKTETFTGQTDASGAHYLRLNFNQQGDPAVSPHPQSVTAQATVMDVNRQAWTSSTTLMVHPASVYIGLHSERYFVELNAPLKIDYIVSDLDGQAAPGLPVTITAARLEWKSIKGAWSEQEVDTQTCSQTSKANPDSCTFQTPVGGSYRITAIVTDASGRVNQTRFTRWVAGGKVPPSRLVQQEVVTLIPDKQTYQPGETAHLLVLSPFSPAEGLLTVSRSGTLYTKRFSLGSSSTSLDIPIESADIPNLEVQVDLAGSAPRVADDGVTPLPNIPARPAYASGALSLSIPPLERTLSVQVTPEQPKVQPGAQTSVSVLVKDAGGQPVANAEVSVVVVDEAILSLTGYKLDNPLDIFYTNRPANLSVVYSRASLVLADPLALAQQQAQSLERGALVDNAGGAMPAATSSPAMPAAAPMEKASAAPHAAPNIQVRSDFNPLAAWAPAVVTGPDGSATVSFKLPDNLTRYRVMAVAVDSGGKKFGKGEASLTARLPLMVRPSAPRFLNFGDTFELPVVLQNQTDAPLVVDVAARATNLKLAMAGLRVSVPANDRVEVRFPASTDMAGTARVQIAAVSGDYTDAASLEMPVYTPSTSEAFATYGVIDSGSAAQPVQYPSGVFPQYGGLEITTSSTALQALTDAVLYLVKYPYECSEQIASRVLAIASLRDVLSAFKADGLPAPADLQATVDSDIARLGKMQNTDGGFPYWTRGYESEPFNTVHVALALQAAEAKGFSVPADMHQRVLTYLQQIETHYPAWYSLDTRRTLSAYALFVRNRLGDRDAAKAQALINEAGLDGLPLDAVGWLWPVIDDRAQLAAIRTYVGNKVVETAGAANFTTAVNDQSYVLLSSDRRTDAILLDALIGDSPTSDLIPKLVTGLLSHRDKGRWDNTQENVFVLMALDKYFNTFEAATPDFVAQVWLGDTYAAQDDFHGRSTALNQTLIPMSFVLSATSSGTQNLIINKDGAGRLYYRLGLQYAPTDLHLPALDMGFVVQRTYEAVDNPADVTRDTNGQWIIKAGARVRVRISMVADNRRYHVALVDPLPAGLEIINPDLAVSGSVPQDPNSPDSSYGWWWWRATWYDHQNLRDDRAEAFTSLLWDGVYNYSYVARATTPGTFIVPPSKAEEMYSPEVFGRSAGDVVVVK